MIMKPWLPRVHTAGQEAKNSFLEEISPGPIGFASHATAERDERPPPAGRTNTSLPTPRWIVIFFLNLPKMKTHKKQVSLGH